MSKIAIGIWEGIVAQVKLLQMWHQRCQLMDGQPVQLVTIQYQFTKRERGQDGQLGGGQSELVGQKVVGQVEKLEAAKDGQELEDLGPFGDEVVGQIEFCNV